MTVLLVRVLLRRQIKFGLVQMKMDRGLRLVITIFKDILVVLPKVHGLKLKEQEQLFFL